MKQVNIVAHNAPDRSPSQPVPLLSHWHASLMMRMNGRVTTEPTDRA